MAKVLDELYTLLGFKVDDGGLMKFKLAVVGVGATIAKFTADTINAVVELDNFNKITGISSELLNEWQIIAQRNNVSSNTILNAFETITKARGDLLSGKSISNAWALLGINPSDNPEETFKNILDNLKAIDDINVRATRLEDLGLDKNLLNLIDGKGIEFFKGKVLTEAQRKDILALKQTFTDMKISLSLMKDKLVALMSPIRFVINAWRRIGEVIYTIIDKTISWKVLLGSFAAIFSLIFAKCHPLIALFTLIGLAIEDIITYLQGGDSVIGSIIEDLKTVATFLKDVLGNLINSLIENLRNGLKSVFQWSMKLLEPIIKLFSMIGKFKGKVAEKLGLKDNTEVKLKGKEEDYLNVGEREEKQEKRKIQPTTLKEVNELFKFGIQPDIKNNNTSSTINNNPTITNNFNIDGARQPQAVGNEIFNLQKQLNNSSLLMESL